MLALVLAWMGLSMQGCFHKAFQAHFLANWRGKDNYLMTYAFDSGGTTGKILNSCSIKTEEPSLQCSGRGTCVNAYPENMANELYFCKCDHGWADPECRTPRKSHAIAFALSCFFGWCGADHFYLGLNPFVAAGKMLTLGGFGVWWIVDMVRIGSARVYANNYRVSDDLPHWAFVAFGTMFAMSLGFMAGVAMVGSHIIEKRKNQELQNQRTWTHKIV